MSETALPKIVVEERIEMGVFLIGVLAALATAYYTGQTGNAYPLFGVCAVLTLVILFVTSES